MKNNLHYQLLVIAVPMILSNITVPLLGLVDTAVIGHLEHAYFLGGSAVGAMIISTVVWLCGFLRMTTTGLAAQSYGEQDHQQGTIVLARGLVVALMISMLMLVLQSPFIELALKLSGGSEQVSFYARQYAEIRIWGLPAALFNLVLLGWLLGHHKAKAVMWLLIITNLVNLLLDLLFVVYFDWQVAGIAAASLVAEYVCCVIGFYLVSKQIPKGIIDHWHLIKRQVMEQSALFGYIKLNRDILIRTLSLQLCFIFITFQGARLGDMVVAANAILMNFLLFISFGLDGIANAAEVMVGKAKGEKNFTQFKRIVKVSLSWTLGFALLYSALFYVAGPGLIRLISSIEAVVLFADQFLPWIVALPILACWSYLFDGIYIGLTQARAMRNGMLISTFLCFFPIWWFTQSLQNHGLWLALSVFMLARALTLMWHYKSRILVQGF